jgi:acetyl-CoA carboxylase carboxyltransferase component
MALKLKLPLVMTLATSGTDVNEGPEALAGWGQAAQALSSCSGIVPTIVVVDGPVLAGPALLLGLFDIVMMTEQSYAYVSSPAAVQSFTGRRLGANELGGYYVHSTTSGVCTFEVRDRDDALELVEYLLSILPENTDALPPRTDPAPRPFEPIGELRELVPATPTSSYDVKDVISHLSDDGDYIELWPRYAPHLVVALAHIDGYTVGYVANQPQTMAGTLDIEASQKGARFVSFCDTFNIPIVTLVDTPGFLPGKDLEWRGMIRHGAELVFAYAEAATPRICVILRKAFGGAYIVMDSKNMGNDLCYAWPTAQIAVMGALGAVQILFKKRDDSEKVQLQEEYTENFLTPYKAAERGFVDAVIDPADTRRLLAQALGTLSSKRELLTQTKHTNSPQ